MEGCRNMMLLMVLTGDDAVEAIESRLLLIREEADDDRRNDVRRVVGEKRAAMEWNLEDCILDDGIGVSNDKLRALRSKETTSLVYSRTSRAKPDLYADAQMPECVKVYWCRWETRLS